MTSLSAQEIYDNFHTQAQGTSGLALGQQCARQLAVNLQDRAVAAQTLVNGIGAGWRGAAAEAAAQGLTPFAVNAFQNHQGFDSGQNIVSSQMDAFQTVVSEVQPIPPAPQMQDVLFSVTNGGSNLAPMRAQFAQYNAVQQANVDAYNKYVAASQANSDVPSIMPVSAPDAPVSVVAAPAGSVATSGSLGSQPYDSSFPSAAPGGTGSARTTRPVDAGGRSAPVPSSVPRTTGPSGPNSSTTPSTSPENPSMPAPPGPGSSPVGSGGVVAPSGTMPPPGGSVGPVGPGVGVGVGAPGDDGDSNPGSRQPGGDLPGVVFGWGSPAEGDFGGGGPSSYGSGAGGGSVFGPRAGAKGGWAEEPGAPASSAGMSGGGAREPAGIGEPGAPQETPGAFAPIAPAHGIRPEDDRDHRRKARDEDEPGDEQWGIVDQVAPSVIGANLATPAGQ
jgi:hypothetical protein